MQGLELGADDYVTKPFDIQELRLRVRNALHRVTPSSLTNPVTGLPEGVLVDERLQECLTAGDWGLLVVAIDNFGEFRESYGFVTTRCAIWAAPVILSVSWVRLNLSWLLAQQNSPP
jgi:PleD family two-component response regulator